MVERGRAVGFGQPRDLGVGANGREDLSAQLLHEALADARFHHFHVGDHVAAASQGCNARFHRAGREAQGAFEVEISGGVNDPQHHLQLAVVEVMRAQFGKDDAEGFRFDGMLFGRHGDWILDIQYFTSNY